MPDSLLSYQSQEQASARRLLWQTFRELLRYNGVVHRANPGPQTLPKEAPDAGLEEAVVKLLLDAGSTASSQGNIMVWEREHRYALLHLGSNNPFESQSPLLRRGLLEG